MFWLFLIYLKATEYTNNINLSLTYNRNEQENFTFDEYFIATGSSF